MKNNKIRRRVFSTFFLLLIIQIYLINAIVYVCKEYDINSNTLNKSIVKSQEILISDTIRVQQRYMLSAIKQTWMKHLEDYEDNLLAKDDNGHPIYSNNESNIGFDIDTMYKVQKESNSFDIYKRSDGTKLIADAKPQWNSEEVDKILSLLVAPIKIFGNNSGAIVFDSYSGEVFLDTTKVQRQGSIFEDSKNKLNKNPEETSITIRDYMMIKKDSDKSSEFIYMFNEETLMGNNSNDFEMYPLGQYNRQFVEQLILPYETFGFDGQPMQLTIMLIADEQDIYKAYVNNTNNIKDALIINTNLYGKVLTILVISTFILMGTMLIAVYVIKYVPNKKGD